MMRALATASFIGLMALGCAQTLPCEAAFALPTLDGVAIPDDGASLPTNGLVHVAIFSGGVPIQAEIRADTADAQDVRSLDVDDIGDIIRVNLEGLAPSTSYTLTLRIDAVDAFSESDVVRDIHFVTLAGPDDVAPTIAGEAELDVRRGFAGGCDPQGDTNVITVTPPAAEDDVAIAAVKLLRVRDDGARELRDFALAGELLSDKERQSGEYAYELVAVDVAGNESAPLQLPVPVSGCSAAGASMPAFVVLAVLLARRRRSVPRGGARASLRALHVAPQAGRLRPC